MFILGHYWIVEALMLIVAYAFPEQVILSEGWTHLKWVGFYFRKGVESAFKGYLHYWWKLFWCFTVTKRNLCLWLKCYRLYFIFQEVTGILSLFLDLAIVVVQTHVMLVKSPYICMTLYTTQILPNVNVTQHFKMWVLFPLLFTVASEYRN